jgi:dolichol-phosphate mannosyltransferase
LISFIIAAFIVFNWNYLVNLKKTWRYDKYVEIPPVGMNPLVSIVIPTYNEKENVEILIPKIFEILKRNRMKVEVIIVDDNSPDGTGKIAEKMKSKHRVKVIHRKKKLGLSSAVLEGFRKAEGEIIGVMDADLSHSPENIPKLVKPIVSNESDIVVASRHVEGGKVKDWPFSRRLISKVGTFLAKFLTNVKDPGSGFFFFKSSVIEGKELNPIGFKMGLEVLVKGEYSKTKEIPYTFVNREIGESKLNSKEYLKYIKHLIKLYWYKINK